MAFKHAYAVVSTNFDLEPVLKQYLATYPEFEERFKYQIVFEVAGEHHPDGRSYLIVFENTPGGRNPDWTDFLNSYCLVHKLAFQAHPSGNVFPDISHNIKALSGQK